MVRTWHSLNIVLAWLNALWRSRDGVGMNRSGRRRSVQSGYRAIYLLVVTSGVDVAHTGIVKTMVLFDSCSGSLPVY